MNYPVESPIETQASIFRILSRTLQIAEFIKLEPEAQRLTLEETQRLLFSQHVLMVNKRSILTYLQVFSTAEVSNGVKALAAAIIDKWDDAPLQERKECQE